MSRWRAAIDQSLLLHQNPGLLDEFKRNPLPDGMATLIRLVSDEGGRRRDLAVMLGMDEAVLQHAAIVYLQSICLYPESSDARALGLNSLDDIKTAKEHHRLLLKWLHPDRNPDHRELAERVNRAWSSVKRSAQDSDLPAPVAAADSLYRDTPPMPAAGRFPMFLWAVIGLSVLLLIVSLMPNSEIYVGSDELAGVSSPEVLGMPTEPKALDTDTENQIDALKQSFEDPKPEQHQAMVAQAKLARQTPVEIKVPTPKPNPPVQADKSTVAVASPPTLPTKPIVPIKPKQPIEKPVLALQPKPSVPPMPTVRATPPATPVLARTTPQIPEKTTPPVQVAVTEEKPALNLTTAGQAVMLEFKRNYSAGNIGSFMAMFSDNARNERGGRQAIYEDYSKFFESSSSRKINFSKINCRPAVQHVTCTAVYSTSVKRKGKLLPDSLQGRIELQMSALDNRLLIDRIRIGA
jgi:hypothetical protein